MSIIGGVCEVLLYRSQPWYNYDVLVWCYEWDLKTCLLLPLNITCHKSTGSRISPKARISLLNVWATNQRAEEKLYPWWHGWMWCDDRKHSKKVSVHKQGSQTLCKMSWKYLVYKTTGVVKPGSQWGALHTSAMDLGMGEQCSTSSPIYIIPAGQDNTWHKCIESASPVVADGSKNFHSFLCGKAEPCHNRRQMTQLNGFRQVA